jgi:tetratricopeptide (TPR) repeat protein
MQIRNTFFVMVCLWVCGTWADPLLVAVLMVKNEAKVMEATLQPYVDGGVEYFVIFDTGSTDGTQEVTKSFFERYPHCKGHVIQSQFIDFATSRNQALDAAQELYPDATFMLMPDAEWYMHDVQGLLDFCRTHEHDKDPSYLLCIRGATLTFYTARLIRRSSGTRFVGVVHEVLDQSTRITLPENIYFAWSPGSEGVKKSYARWIRDRNLLLKSYNDNPYDPRTVFYLAQTYECIGDHEHAYEYYKKRLDVEGWDEENFVNYYRLGRVATALEEKNKKSTVKVPHDSPVLHYLQAFSYRPSRAEAIIKIAEYYLNKGDMHLAYLFASRAAQVPYPSKDILFVEKYLYDYTRYDVLGIAAWYVGEYTIGEWAVRQALKVKPDAPHLHGNLKLYLDRKNKK